MQTRQGSLLALLAIFFIDIYRNSLSQFMLPACRFYPTCSAYAREAIIRRGAIRGVCMAFWRVCRCHPFARHGIDWVK